MTTLGLLVPCIIQAWNPGYGDHSGWALPVTKPRRYRAPRALSEFGLEKIPRSFRYVAG